MYRLLIALFLFGSALAHAQETFPLASDLAIPESWLIYERANLREGTTIKSHYPADDHGGGIRETYNPQSVRIGLSHYRDGKQDGVVLTWYDDGTLESRLEYRQGMRHGVCRHWNRQGQLTSVYTMVEGTGTIVLRHENGFLKKIEDRKGDVAHGRHFEFADDGRVKHIGWMEKGRFHGPYLSYFEDGQVLNLAYLQNGSPENLMLRGRDPNGDRTNGLVVTYFRGNVEIKRTDYEALQLDHPDLPAPYLTFEEYLDYLSQPKETNLRKVLADYADPKPATLPVPDP